MFRHRAFALYWFSRIASILSFHMLVVAVGWQLYELTGSAFDLGLLGLAQFGPMLVLTLFVGHVADRYDHRIILMLCQITEGCGAAILVYATATGSLGTPRHLRRRRGGRLGARLRNPDHGGDHLRRWCRAPWCRRRWRGLPRPTRPARSSGRRSAACSICSGRRTVYGLTIVLWGLGGFMLALMRVEPAPR